MTKTPTESVLVGSSVNDDVGPNKLAKQHSSSKKEADYLSASEDDDKIGRVPLRNLSRDERTVHILRLWRTCYNFSLGAAIMSLQSKSLVVKIRLYGRQLVAQQSNNKMKRNQ